MNFVEHLFCSSALLDLVNIVQVGLDLRNATGAKNLLSKFTQPKRARYNLQNLDEIPDDDRKCYAAYESCSSGGLCGGGGIWVYRKKIKQYVQSRENTKANLSKFGGRREEKIDCDDAVTHHTRIKKGHGPELMAFA